MCHDRGSFHAETAANIILDSLVVEGTICTNDQAFRELLVRRMKAPAAKTTEVFGGTETVQMHAEVPPSGSRRTETEYLQKLESSIWPRNIGKGMLTNQEHKKHQ